jgi:hypothetical protein
VSTVEVKTVTVGKLGGSAKTIKGDAGATLSLPLAWTHPKAWTQLRSIEAIAFDGAKQVGTITLTPAGKVSASGKLALVKDATKIGHHGKTVTAELGLKVAKSLKGHTLSIDIAATDRDGKRQVETRRALHPHQPISPFQTAGAAPLRRPGTPTCAADSGRIRRRPATHRTPRKETPDEPSHRDQPQRRRLHEAIRNTRRDQGAARDRAVPVPCAQPVDPRRAHPLHDPGLLRRLPGGHLQDAAVRAPRRRPPRRSSARRPAAWSSAR